ncbi:hypothetical protein [Haloferula sp. BvORR071]|uniref:hypothetical protein n=1 Tax=Haloferula sp. BvORR071 TaxID=1396141 RepID=UPI00224101E1|nr:hypothetical protein [Haloferula sp. BvORR071]
MREIIIPLIAFEDTSLEEAIDFLRLRSRELDPDQSMPGMGPMVIGKSSESENPRGRQIKELRMKDVSLWDALQRVARETGMRVVITDRAIELQPK